MTASPNRQPADDNRRALVVPAWGDEFDLTDFFLRLEPARFEFRDGADLPWVEDVFKTVQGFILRWVALYRSLVRSANVHPEAVTKSVICVRRMGELERSAYCSWFSSPNKDFDSTSPHGWFVRNGLEEVCHFLRCERFASSVFQESTSGNVIKTGLVTPTQSTASGFGANAGQIGLIGTLAQLGQLANSELDPPFNLRPLS